MKILVPTDFSENANNAFEFAKKIARRNSASITLLFAYYNVYDFAAQSASIMVEIEQNANEAMVELNKDKDNDIRVDHKIVQGSVATAVASTAYREDYDLIIMGTQGASGIRKGLIGSNTAHVIKDSMVPVLVIPSNATYDGVKQMVVSLEWETSELEFFERLFQITQQWEWPYRTLHVKTPEDEPLNKAAGQLNSFLKQSRPKITHDTVSAESLLKGINEYLQTSGNSLLVMFAKQKPFFEYLLHKGHIEKMAYHTHVPLLVIR